MPIRWMHSLADDDVPRWQPFAQLVASWGFGLKPDDGVSIDALVETELRLELHLPTALRELYLLAGRRDDLLRAQNRLQTLDRLEVRDDHLVFWEDQHGEVVWGVANANLHEENPPVEMIRDGAAIRCNERLSRFATQMLLLDLFAMADHGILARLNSEITTQLTAIYPRLALPNWPWPASPTRFHADADSVLVIDGTDRLYASSRRRRGHDRLVAFLEGRGVDLDMEWTQ